MSQLPEENGAARAATASTAVIKSEDDIESERKKNETWRDTKEEGGKKRKIDSDNTSRRFINQRERYYHRWELFLWTGQILRTITEQWSLSEVSCYCKFYSIRTTYQLMKNLRRTMKHVGKEKG